MKNENKIRQAIKRKLEAQRAQPDIPAGEEVEAARRFGSFLSTACQGKGWSAGDLALKLNIEPALAEAILNGSLPRSEIDDDFLSDIAGAIGCEFESLKGILDQNAAP